MAFKVNALNGDSLIIYKGETDVQVNAGVFTQVILTFMATGQVTGSIYIQVNWKKNITHWIDYSGNSLLSVKDMPYSKLLISQGQVMYDSSKYKMWFTNTYNSGKFNINYAVSNDRIT